MLAVDWSRRGKVRFAVRYKIRAAALAAVVDIRGDSGEVGELGYEYVAVYRELGAEVGVARGIAVKARKLLFCRSIASAILSRSRMNAPQAVIRSA